MHSKKIFFILSIALLTIGAGCSKTSTPTTNNYQGGPSAEELFVKNEPASINNDQNTLSSTSQHTVTSTNSSTTTSPMEFNASKRYTAILHTSHGDIEIALNFGQTPNTVKNFVDLSRKNFYNNTIFHRVISGFMIQGGDPEGNGTGGPGYRFDDEPFTGEYTKGTVAMANAGPNTNGSQFFIMHADYPLPKNYTIFGQVTKGIEVVDTIAASKVEYSSSGELSKPVEATVITKVDIIES